MHDRPVILSEYEVNSPDEMANFGKRLARIVGIGDVLFLIGDLGTGKTTLAQGLIGELAIETSEITSPTYNLVHVYTAEKFEIWHADLYRLKGPEQVIQLGLEDAFSHALTLVEWPDRMGEMAPKNRLDIVIKKTENGRNIALRAADSGDPEGWKGRLNGL